MKIEQINDFHAIPDAIERAIYLSNSTCDNIMCEGFEQDWFPISHTKLQCPRKEHWERLLRKTPSGKLYTLTYVAKHPCRKHGCCPHVLVSNRVSLVTLCMECDKPESL